MDGIEGYTIEGYTVIALVDPVEIVLDCDRCGLPVTPPENEPKLADLVRAARAHTDRCTG